jgi:hypothetical protein
MLAMRSGESPKSEHTREIVYAVVAFGFVIVAMRAEEPKIRIMQKMVKKIQPELFIAPCLVATKRLARRAGL